jgi:tetratricopeptide (TPR) repeat protein
MKHVINLKIMNKMNIKTRRTILLILVLSFTSASMLNAQERNDVIKVYNEGAKSMQTDLPAAIQAFESVVALADKAGGTADDLKQKAVQVLPGLYIRAANNAIKENKSAPEIIKAAKTAAAAAEKYGSESSKENASKIMVQGYNKMGTDFFTQKNYENALLAFDSLLSINPGYVNAIYNKALIFRSQNNNGAFEEAIDLFLGKLEGGSNEAAAKQASSLALEYFRAAGSQANQADSLDKAIALLNKAAKYGDDKDLFYFYADVYNKQKNFDNGAEFARKGLELETGDAEAKAKFYYQLAVAQAGKGQNSEACASFKNALYGAFAEASKAQRINLKCE